MERLDYSFIDNADGIVVPSGGGITPIGKAKINEWNDPDRFLAGRNLLKRRKQLS